MGVKFIFLTILVLIVTLMFGCTYRNAMNSGKKCFESGLYDESVPYFKTALDKKPNKADAKIWYSKAKEKAAENHYNKALGNENTRAWAVAAVEYEKTLSFISDYKDAAARLESVKYTDATESYQKGCECLTLEAWDEAISEFESSLELIPTTSKLADDSRSGILQAREKAAEEHYQKGLAFETKEQWKDALTEYQTIGKYKIAYKDSSEHMQVCHQALAAYYYQEGMTFEERGNWQGAYDSYQETANHVPNYEDTGGRLRRISRTLAEEYMGKGDGVLAQAVDVDLRKRQRLASDALDLYEIASKYDRDCPGLSDKIRQANNLKIIRVAVLPFTGGTGIVAKEITNGITNNIVKSNRSDVKAVDRSQLDTILSEIDLSSSGLVDSNTLKKSGGIKGVDILISGEVVSYSYKPERTSEARTETKYNFDANPPTSYESSYTQYTEKRTGTIKASIKLINATTAEIEWTDVIEANAEDNASWRSDKTQATMKTAEELYTIVVNQIVQRFSSEILGRI